MGVDFGSSRIGVAFAETDVRIASPRASVKASGRLDLDAATLVALAKREEAELIVIGLPLSGGEETRMSLVCRKLGAKVEEASARVAFVDESYTSASGEEDMVQAGLKGSERRKASDGEAACRILERFMETHA